MRPIVVCTVGDARWTMRAVHLASAMARSTHTPLVLLRMIPALNPGLLGTAAGIHAPARAEADALLEYAAVAEDYGAEVIVQPVQYVSLAEMIVQAAEALDAVAVFAQLPQQPLPLTALWRRFQTWHMRRQLEGQQRQFFTLETVGSAEDSPERLAAVHWTSAAK